MMDYSGFYIEVEHFGQLDQVEVPDMLNILSIPELNITPSGLTYGSRIYLKNGAPFILTSSGVEIGFAVESSGVEIPQLNTVTTVISGGVTMPFPDIPLGSVVSIFVDEPKIGNFILSTGTIDSDNTSTGDANIRNGTYYTDLCYNNSSAGFPKSLPGLDLGSDMDVGTVRLYWWNNAAFTASSYRIQYSTDGVIWNDAVTGIDGTGKENDFQDINVESAPDARYWRPFIDTSNNASWCVYSELECFTVASGTTKKLVYIDPNTYPISSSGGSDALVITSNAGGNFTFTINYFT